MISFKHNFLFIHIPKTGGNSIQSILGDYSEDKIVCLEPHHDGIECFEVRSGKFNIKKHSTLLDYQLELGKDAVKKLFKFTCVRNPWERMISFYFSPHRGVVDWHKESFVSLVKQVKPVLDFTTLNHTGKMGPTCFENIDYYIRYERLQRDFTMACQHIGIPFTQLPERNVSKHENYSSYYDDALIDLVRKRFYREISFFGYRYNE